MYNQFQNSFQSQASGINSQYRGLETKYQPIGNVQSQYNQSLNQGLSGQFHAGFNQQQAFASSYAPSQFQGQQSYHTANYRGNQQGHDDYLRSDSTQSAQSQFGIGAVSNFSSGSPYAASSFASGSAVQANQPYNNFQNQHSYHTANYRGDQQGHDAYLRSDSTQPAQSQFGIGAVSSSFSSGSPYISSHNAAFSQQHEQHQQHQQQPFSSSYAQSQFPSQQSYHTANYRGNQQGHDAYLRSDSTQPAQSQFGIGAASYNRYQF